MRFNPCRLAPPLGLLLALGSHGAARAAEPVRIEDIRVRLFLERSGKLSDDLVPAKKTLRNTPMGEGDAGEPASAVFVELVFMGPKNAAASKTLARDTAGVTATQTVKGVRKVVLTRAYGGFLFGEGGIAHRAFMLDGVTCAPLEIEVKVGKSRKAAKVDFECGE